MIAKYSFLDLAKNREAFFNIIAAFYPRSDWRYKLIEKAYNDAKDAFRGKEREDGERYFEHIRAVTLILIMYLRRTEYKLIVAALLHDIVEDCPQWTIERVEREYGLEIAVLVDFLTKPDMSGFKTKEERNHVYHFRFQHAPRDFFFIKLADRLHNTLTLGTCLKEKQLRKIAETKEHYLPHAERQFILFHEINEAVSLIEQAV
jgi:guanosine-3',5'-bis(diphosphate) 3'-pyrophosphohydrolase